MSSATERRELRRPTRGRASYRRLVPVGVVLGSGLGFGCGPSDGIVGVVAMSSASGEAPTFETEFPGGDPAWQAETGILGATVTLGDASTTADDGRVATLILPGHADYGSNDGLGSDVATTLSSTQRFGYGTYRSRVAFGGCTSGEEATQAMLGYFSNGTDGNANGIRDEIEIDFQVLCGTPSLAYLTVFTDYEERASGDVFRKLSHVVDFSTGRTYDTPSASDDAFVEGTTDPSLQLDFFAAGTFYELGFEWHVGSLRFFLDVGSGEKTLWTLSDPERVPSGSVQVVYNAWHPESHWFPFDGVADYPAEDVVMSVDWFRFYAE